MEFIAFTTARRAGLTIMQIRETFGLSRRAATQVRKMARKIETEVLADGGFFYNRVPLSIITSGGKRELEDLYVDVGEYGGATISTALRLSALTLVGMRADDRHAAIIADILDAIEVANRSSFYSDTINVRLHDSESFGETDTNMHAALREMFNYRSEFIEFIKQKPDSLVAEYAEEFYALHAEQDVYVFGEFSFETVGDVIDGEAFEIVELPPAHVIAAAEAPLAAYVHPGWL